MKIQFTLAAMIGMMWLCVPALGQQNFFNRGGVALYNPEIDVIVSGPLLEVRPVVSKDLKYVTISAAPRVVQLVNIQNFPVMAVGGGLVGGVRPAAAGVVNNMNVSMPVRVRNAAGTGVLNQTGMIKVMIDD